jgi:hypothetical protein
MKHLKLFEKSEYNNEEISDEDYKNYLLRITKK